MTDGTGRVTPPPGGGATPPPQRLSPKAREEQLLERLPPVAEKQPYRPGSIKAALQNFNTKLSELHPAAKYVFWGAVGLSLAAGVTATIIISGGWQKQVVEGLKQINLENIKHALAPGVIGVAGLSAIFIAAHPDTLKPGGGMAFAETAAVFSGTLGVMMTGMGLALLAQRA